MVSEGGVLGGVRGAADVVAGIHLRTVNASHGAATQAVRAQIERALYHDEIVRILKNDPK